MLCLIAQAQGPSWEVVSQWGPAIPLLMIVLWFFDRMSRRIEKGMRDVRDAMIRMEVHASERHTEAMSLLRDIRNEACDGHPPPRRRRKDPPNDGD